MFLEELRKYKNKGVEMVAFIIAIITCLILFLSIIFYNNLVTKKNNVTNTFSSIDVMLQKRYDLIPNLVETLKGYAKHEKMTLESMAMLRTQTLDKSLSVDERVFLDNEISKDMGTIFALCEDYPDLKASTQFLKLQEELVAMEDELSAARRTYNAAVTEYNNFIEIFPSNIIASIVQYEKCILFKTDNIEKQSVNFKDVKNG